MLEHEDFREDAIIKWLRAYLSCATELIICNNCVHLSLANVPFERISASCCALLTYLILIAGSKLILSNRQTKLNLVSSGHVSHCRTSSFIDH